jgi:hypothetical protein
MSSDTKKLFSDAWKALDALAKAHAVARFDFKVRFLDKASIEYQYRNPKCEKAKKK